MDMHFDYKFKELLEKCKLVELHILGDSEKHRCMLGFEPRVPCGRRVLAHLNTHMGSCHQQRINILIAESLIHLH